MHLSLPKFWPRQFRQAAIFFAVFLLLTGCAISRSNTDPDLQQTAKKPDIPDKILVRDDTDPILSLKLSDDMFVPTPLEESQLLPDAAVSNFSAVDATAVEAFRLLMVGRNIAITADPGTDEVKVNITNYSGSLQEVVERISETAGVFYTYRNGLLRLSKDRNFIVTLPPIESALDEMSGMITALGSSDVKLDKSARLVTFRANRQAFDSIKSYLERIRNQKVMIVYETYFLEVGLNDLNRIGINWNQVTTRAAAPSGGTPAPGSPAPTTPSTPTLNTLQENTTFLANRAFGNGTSGSLNIIGSGAGMAFGTLFTSGSLNMNVLFDFLSSQGNVETLSRPTITMMSGGKSKFEVGRKIRFVSRRGVATTEGVSTTQATFETEDLSTGLKVEVAGDYSDDTVYTNIKLSVDDLIRFTDPDPLGENSIQLPETATRALETGVRVRPGDAILIAGINQTRDSTSNSGPFNFDGFMPFLRSREKVVDRSELVIVLKPRVVRFKRDEMTAGEITAAKEAKEKAEAEKNALVPPTGDFVAPSVIMKPTANPMAQPVQPVLSTPLIGNAMDKQPDMPMPQNRPRLPGLRPPALANETIAQPAPDAAILDPMVDSLGYYGRGGVRQ
jgi:MSHA biogenesis protein MshL